MPNVFFTDRPFRPGDAFHTREFRAANAAALAELPPVHAEVEAFLEEVRVEHYPALPARATSVVVVPWPAYHTVEGKGPSGAYGASIRERAPDPLGDARFCYYVGLKRDTRRALVDETWVDTLVARWGGLRGTFEKWNLAASYWDGRLTFGPAPVTALVEGEILVEKECEG